MNINKLTKAEVERLNKAETVVPVSCFYNNEWAELMLDNEGYFIYYFFDNNNKEEQLFDISQNLARKIKAEALKFGINDANRTLTILNFINKGV